MHKIKHIFIVQILERMAEIMEEDKVTIKEEISTVEDTIKVVEEDVNVESTEHQGMGKWLNIIYIYLLRMTDFLLIFRTSRS